MALRMFPRWIFCSAVCAGVLGAIGACSPGDTPADCPPPHAAFRLTVDCAEGAVPGNVIIRVVYGSGVEEFDASHPDDTPQSVFCSLHYLEPGDSDASASQDAGDEPDQGKIGSVVCELWTDGAATVTVKAGGYPDVTRELSAERDECGLVLTEEQITLERAD